MKKSIILALITIIVMSLAGTASAFPLNFNGEFKVEGVGYDDFGYEKGSLFRSGFKLNFEGQIAKDTVFFGRISARNNFGDNYFGSFSDAGRPAAIRPASGGGPSTFGTELDQYGIITKAGKWNLTLGRQAVMLGKGVIIDTGTLYSGLDNKFDGLVATTTMGKVDASVIAGKTTRNLYYAREWYGLDLSTKVSDNFTLGAAYASGRVEGRPSDKYLAFNAAATFNKFMLTTEYARSNADSHNIAYLIAGMYSWDKDSFTVQYNKVDRNSVDVYNSGIAPAKYPLYDYTYNPEYKGMTYNYTHTINKNLSLSVTYMDLKSNYDSEGSQKEYAAGLTWKF